MRGEYIAVADEDKLDNSAEDLNPSEYKTKGHRRDALNLRWRSTHSSAAMVCSLVAAACLGALAALGLFIFAIGRLGRSPENSIYCEYHLSHTNCTA